MNRYQRGFTLLEVLLAGFILFLILTSMTQVYQGAILSSARAEKALEIIGVVPSIRVIVTNAVLDDRVLSGEGSYGDVTYEWTAILVYEGTPSLSVSESNPSARFFLWHIDLKIFKDRVERQYRYRELGW